MAMPSGRRSSEPAPWPSASGSRAEHRAHRRHHDRTKPQQTSLVDRLERALALVALGLERKIDHHDRVLLDDADQQNDADERDQAQVVVPNSISTSSAPTPAEGSVDRIVIGWMKLS